MLARMLHLAEGVLRGRHRAPAAAETVLLLEYRLPLGCCVHLSPVFEAIKRSRPEVQIVLATRGLGAQVHRHSPFVDHLIETPDPLTELVAAVTTLRAELRRRGLRPDCVLTGASDSRTRISLLGLLVCGGWRGGYTLKPALYQHPLAYDAGLSLIANNLRMAQLIGCSTLVTQPRVFYSERDLDTASALLAGINPSAKPVVTFVTQNSGGQNTGWHTERFVEVLKAMQDRGCVVVYVGTTADVPAIAALDAAAGGLGHSLAGQTTVTELAAVLALSDLVITLDTGTMHVGRAVGVPMVVLGPSWQRPLEWLPLGVANVRILRGEDVAVALADYRLDKISVASVLAAADELLSLYPPSDEARSGRAEGGVSDTDHRERVSAG